MRKQRPGPFAVNVRDLVRRPGEMREVEIDIDAPEQWGEGLVSVAKGTPILIDARIESVHEGMLISADVDSRYEGVCGRCLIDIAAPVEVEFQELFAYPGGETSDFEVQDDHVDLENLVRDAIVLSLPFQPVCQPDCPGLDPATGERIAGESDTERREPVDSRWAALQDYTTDPDAGATRAGAENTEES